MLKTRTWALVLLLPLAFPAFHAAAKPADVLRLGIVSEAELRAEADLLTVELAAVHGLELVERVDIERVLKEQRLAAGSGGRCEWLRLGGLLAADGLVILAKEQGGDESVLSARLVATSTGVVLGAIYSKHPLDDPDAFCRAIHARIAGARQKMAVPADEAVAISLLGVHCSVSFPGANELEQTLNTLLARRFLEVPALFVLERWRMEKLAWEKATGAGNAAPFWTGSYLVEGTVEGGRHETNSVRIMLTLAGPRAAGTRHYAARGKRSEATVLVDRLVLDVVRDLNVEPRVSKWNTAVEAAAFQQEAQWAFNARQFEHARYSCESAWALGGRANDLALLRICAYIGEAWPGDVPRQGRLGDASPWGGLDRLRPWRVDLARILRSLRFCGAHLDTLRAGRIGMSRDDGRVAAVLLAVCSRILLDYYLLPAGAAEEAELLRRIRALLRRISVMVIEFGTYDDRLMACGWMVKSGALWQETLEEGVQVYREVLVRDDFDPGDLTWLRKVMVSSRTAPVLAHTSGRPWSVAREKCGTVTQTPWLVAWGSDSRERLHTVWRGFLTELLEDEAVSARFDGFVLSSHYRRDDKFAAKCADFLWVNRRELMGSPRYFGALATFNSGSLTASRGRALPHDLWIGLSRYVLTETADISPLSLLQYVSSYPKITETEAEELLLHFRSFRERVLDNESTSNPDRDDLSGFERMLLGLASAESQDQAVQLRGLQPRRVWRPEDGRMMYTIRSIIWREDRLWALTYRTRHGRGDARVCSIDPHTGESEELPCLRFGRGLDPRALDVGTNHVVVVFDGRGSDNVFVFDRVRSRWSPAPVAREDYSAVLSDGAHFYLGFRNWRATPSRQPSGLLKVHGTSFDMTVLASSRRKPARGILDACPPYGVVSLFGGSRGRVRVGVKFDSPVSYKVLEYEPVANVWHELFSSRILFLSCESLEGTMLYSADRGIDRYLYLPRAEEHARLLVDDESDGGHDCAVDGRWERPAFLRKYAGAWWEVAAFDGQDLWVVSQSERWGFMRAELVGFRGGRRRSHVVPIAFETRGVVTTPRDLVLWNRGELGFVSLSAVRGYLDSLPAKW